MADACPHLHEPTREAWERLRNPLQWACDSCRSTDGIWCCLRCGHIGCGRRAHLPALGGGHSKHHFYATYADTAAASSSSIAGAENRNKKKRVKILKILRRTSNRGIADKDAAAAAVAGVESSDAATAATAETAADNDTNTTATSSNPSEEMGGHEVCIDIVSKAVHCYACDDYVLSDVPWLASLRDELNGIEVRRDGIEISLAPSSSSAMNSTSGGSGVTGGKRNENEARSSGGNSNDTHHGNSVDEDMFEMVDTSDDAVLVDTKGADGNDHRVETVKSDEESKYQPGITGLTNLGNTCYMNSVIQMLSHCSGFRSFFRDFLRAAAPLRLAGEGGYKITRQTTVRLKEELLTNTPPDKLVLTEATHALLRVLWSGRWSHITPRYFVNAVWKHGGLFAARKQQDANEFLNFFLGRVDDELKNPKAKDSVMMDLFGIDQYQEVKCDNCGTVTRRTEPLLGLVLSLPDETDSAMEGIEEDADAIPEINLLDCFKSLQTTGRFVGDNQFDCDTCKSKQDASWSVSLQRRPQSILISLRRTLWNVEKGVHKDSRRVRFPTELDCSNLLGLEKDRTSPDEDFEGCHYKLNSVVSHSGSSPFVGHYISWCRVNDKWFLFNDSLVTETTEASVLNAQAFILLYERRSIPSVEGTSYPGRVSYV